MTLKLDDYSFKMFFKDDYSFSCDKNYSKQIIFLLKLRYYGLELLEIAWFFPCLRIPFTFRV